MANYQLQRGTYDAYYEDAMNIEKIVEMLKSIVNTYGYSPIHTPMYESTNLFARSAGESSDIVTKEMYNFVDKSGREITLRPELTAGVMRAIVTNKLYAVKDLPLKLSYYGSAFRYERPQAGRLREFHQFGVEIFGAKGAETDAEAIIVADTLLRKLGLQVKLYIYSIGCPTCRAAYNKALKEFFAPNLEKLCFDCKARYEKNPLRLLDCKEAECKKINAGAPSLLDYLCEGCRAHFEALKEYLALAGVEYEIDPRIVRGLDYYTRTVFEFVSTSIGAQGTVCGGGRYDGLIEELGGKPMPAVGFAAGLERLLIVMEQTGAAMPEEPKPEVYIAGMDAECRKKAFEIAIALRRKGVYAEIDHMERSVKAQFKYADKIGAKYVVVIGGNELAEGKANVKHMATGESESVPFDEMYTFLKK